MKCNICGEKTDKIFESTILKEYQVSYYFCPNCNFLQTQDPFWIQEAYKESINIVDTGILARNVELSRISEVIIYIFFDKNLSFLDFAGGYGIFTRLMRDIGFNFYWHDPYTSNLLARGFEYEQNQEIELITSFESFEHFVDPIKEIEGMLNISKNIFFSTSLISVPPPKPKEWWYYGLEHGQHISFYSMNTLKLIANKYNLNLLSNDRNFHLLTEKKINSRIYNLVNKYVNKIDRYVNRKMISKTFEDMEYLIGRQI